MNVVTPCQMYWLTRCDSLCGLLKGLVIFGALLFAILAIFLIGAWVASVEEPNNSRAREGVRKLCIGLEAAFAFTIACATCYALLPTTKEMAAIIVVPRVANSQTVGDLAGGVVTLAREWMQELRPKKTPPMSVPAEKGTATPK